MNENRIVLHEFKVQLTEGPSSPAPCHRHFQGGWGVRYPYSWSTTSCPPPHSAFPGPPSLMSPNVAEAYQPGQPWDIQSLEELRISTTPAALLLLFNCLSNLGPKDVTAHLQVLQLYFLYNTCGWNWGVPQSIFSTTWIYPQWRTGCPVPTIYSVNKVPLSPP